MEPSAHAALCAVQNHLLLSEFERAIEVLGEIDCSNVHDVAFHIHVARLAEDAGKLDRAVLEYNHALRDEPSSIEALRRLAQLRADMGQTARAVRCLEKLLELVPDDPEAVTDLRWLKESEGSAEPLVVPWDEEESIRSADVPLTFYEADAIQLTTRFAGREGVYARQWTSPSERTGYTPVHEPFTPAVARKHLLGDITVGIYVVRLDQTVGFLAFDLDLARHVLERSADARNWGTLQRTVQSAAVRIVDACAALELPAYIEDSGQKGRHVWVFFDRPVPADAARRLAGLVMQGIAEPLPPEVGVEIFPKQSRVHSDGLGNLIKLPLGIHRKTGRRALFLEPDGRPVADQRRLLHELQVVSRGHVFDILSRPIAAESRGASLAAQSADDDARAPLHGERTPEPDAVPRAPYDPEQDEEYLWLIDRCTILAAIARKAEAEGDLSAEERLVFKHTVGHLRNGAEAANATLRKCRTVQPSELLKSPLRGNPMGCRRIQERVPHLVQDAGCECRFESSAGPPTPLLHLMDLRVRGALGDVTNDLSRLQVERLVNDLIRTRVEMAKMSRLESRLQERIQAYMQAKGLAELETPAGVIRLGPGGTLTLTIPMGTPSLVPAPPCGGQAGHDAGIASGERDSDHSVRD